MESTISPVLVKLLLLILQFVPAEVPQFSVHVLQEGMYSGTYKIERSGSGHVFFRKLQADSKLVPFEAERSRRYGQFYTVYVLEKNESFSVGLTEELKALKPVKQARHQIVSGDKASFRLDYEGKTLFIGEEKEKTTAVLELE